MHRTKVPILLSALLATACGDGVNTPELQAALAKARPPGQAPTERVAKTPLPMDGATAHTATERFSLALTLGTTKQTLVIERTLARGNRAAGAPFRVKQTRSWTRPDPGGAGTSTTTDGREAIFDGKRFATRRGHSAWRAQEIWRGDHHTWLRSAYGIGPALLKAYTPLLNLSRKGTDKVAGLDAERLAVSRNVGTRLKRLPDATVKALRDSDPQWFQWLAATHRPETIEGELLRRAGADELFAGNLTFSGIAEVEGTKARFTMSWSRKVTDASPEATAFVVPDKLEPARRERPWLMIESVMRGALVDVYAKRAKK